MRTRKLGTCLSVVVVLALILSACGPAATPTPAPTPTPKGPTRGGKITMAVWQSPITLNANLGTQTVMDEVLVFIVEGFTKV